MDKQSGMDKKTVRIIAFLAVISFFSALLIFLIASSTIQNLLSVVLMAVVGVYCCVAICKENLHFYKAECFPKCAIIIFFMAYSVTADVLFNSIITICPYLDQVYVKFIILFLFTIFDYLFISVYINKKLAKD